MLMPPIRWYATHCSSLNDNKYKIAGKYAQHSPIKIGAMMRVDLCEYETSTIKSMYIDYIIIFLLHI